VGIDVVPVGAGGGCWHAEEGRSEHRSPPLDPPLPLPDELDTPPLDELETPPLDEPLLLHEPLHWAQKLVFIWLQLWQLDSCAFWAQVCDCRVDALKVPPGQMQSSMSLHELSRPSSSEPQLARTHEMHPVPR
jgi:hypothetical protein